MRCYCPYSGSEYFAASNFRDEPTILLPHPIFSLPTLKLLAKARNYGLGRYSDEEEKLLFLAMLHNTGMVTYEVPAEPEVPVVKKHLEQVFKLLTWYSLVDQRELHRFPRLRVTEHNRKMENIGIFISSWYEVRKELTSQSGRRLLAELLEKQEFVLYRLIHSDRDTEKYSTRLANWALDAGKVLGEDKRQEWKELFKLTPETGLFSCDLEELRDLQLWMQEHLYAVGADEGKGTGSIYSAKVLEHLDRLVKLREGGRTSYILEQVGGPSNTFKMKVDGMENSQRISQIQELESEIVASGVAEKEPIQRDYPKFIDWIKAKAAWILTQTKRDDLQYLREKQETTVTVSSVVSNVVTASVDVDETALAPKGL